MHVRSLPVLGHPFSTWQLGHKLSHITAKQYTNMFLKTCEAINRLYFDNLDAYMIGAA